MTDKICRSSIPSPAISRRGASFAGPGRSGAPRDACRVAVEDGKGEPVEKESIHVFVARIRRAISGDEAAAARYDAKGDVVRARESRASAESWRRMIDDRMSGRKARP